MECCLARYQHQYLNELTKSFGWYLYLNLSHENNMTAYPNMHGILVSAIDIALQYITTPPLTSVVRPSFRTSLDFHSLVQCHFGGRDSSLSSDTRLLFSKPLGPAAPKKTQAPPACYQNSLRSSHYYKCWRLQFSSNNTQS